MPKMSAQNYPGIEKNQDSDFFCIYRFTNSDVSLTPHDVRWRYIGSRSIMNNKPICLKFENL